MSESEARWYSESNWIRLVLLQRRMIPKGVVHTLRLGKNARHGHQQKMHRRTTARCYDDMRSLEFGGLSFTTP